MGRACGEGRRDYRGRRIRSSCGAQWTGRQGIGISAIRGRDCISAHGQRATGLSIRERNGNEPHPLHKGAATEALKARKKAAHTGWFHRMHLPSYLKDSSVWISVRKKYWRILSFLLQSWNQIASRHIFLRKTSDARMKILYTPCVHTVERRGGIISNSIDNKIMEVGACCTAERVP